MVRSLRHRSELEPVLHGAAGCCEATVNDDFSAVDVASFIGGQIQNGVSDIPGIAHFTGRALRVTPVDQSLQIIAANRLGEPALDESGVHQARNHGVTADALSCVGDSCRLCKSKQPELSCGIGDVGTVGVYAQPGNRGNVDEYVDGAELIHVVRHSSFNLSGIGHTDAARGTDYAFTFDD